MTTQTFDKTIRYDRQSRDYRAELDGRLIGFFATYHAAEVALDEAAFDALIDGEGATASALDGNTDDDPFGDPRTDEEKRDSVEGWIEFAPCEGYPLGGWEKPHVHPFDDTRTVMVRRPRLFVAADDDEEITAPIPGGPVSPLPTYDNPNDHGRSDASWSTICADPPPSDPLPDDFPGEDIDGVPYPYMRMPEGDILDADGMRVRFAHTRQSMVIEARLTVCGNCQGIHHIQYCPEIRAALSADEPDPPPWTDITLGKELCRMRWVNFKAFVALLLSVPAEHLIIYARSYQAFIRSYAPDSDMTITQVLQVWTREMRGEPSPAIRLAA